MHGNDLDNLVVPRDVLVFEGLLGLLPVDLIPQEAKFRAKGKWTQAVACYDINEMLARRLWDMVWRYSIEVDLITYLGPEFAEAMEARIERENLPLRRIWSDDPVRLARRLPTMVYLRAIYDPNPEHQLLYGSKGRYVAPEQAHRLFGSL